MASDVRPGVDCLIIAINNLNREIKDGTIDERKFINHFQIIEDHLTALESLDLSDHEIKVITQTFAEINNSTDYGKEFGDLTDKIVTLINKHFQPPSYVSLDNLSPLHSPNKNDASLASNLSTYIDSQQRTISEISKLTEKLNSLADKLTPIKHRIGEQNENQNRLRNDRTLTGNLVKELEQEFEDEFIRLEESIRSLNKELMQNESDISSLESSKSELNELKKQLQLEKKEISNTPKISSITQSRKKKIQRLNIQIEQVDEKIKELEEKLSIYKRESEALNEALTEKHKRLSKFDNDENHVKVSELRLKIVDLTRKIREIEENEKILNDKKVEIQDQIDEVNQQLKPKQESRYKDIADTIDTSKFTKPSAAMKVLKDERQYTETLEGSRRYIDGYVQTLLLDPESHMDDTVEYDIEVNSSPKKIETTKQAVRDLKGMNCSINGEQILACKDELKVGASSIVHKEGQEIGSYTHLVKKLQSQGVSHEDINKTLRLLVQSIAKDSATTLYHEIAPTYLMDEFRPEDALVNVNIVVDQGTIVGLESTTVTRMVHSEDKSNIKAYYAATTRVFFDSGDCTRGDATTTVHKLQLA